MQFISRCRFVCALGVVFIAFVLAPALLQAAPPYIDLGAIGEHPFSIMTRAYAYVEMSPGLGPYNSTFGMPHNLLILDTGANSALFVSEAAEELVANGIISAGYYDEVGVAGSAELHVSEPYTFQFWGTTTGAARNTILPGGNTQVMYNPVLDLGGRLDEASFYAIPGVLGMPAMTGRVTTFDMQPWMNQTSIYDIVLMDTLFSNSSPGSANHRYSVQLQADPQFEPEPRPGGPSPVWADVPFATVRAQLGEDSTTGNFLIDTGASMSLLSTDFATDLGLDTNHDGSFDSLDDTYVGDVEVGGLGGTTWIPVCAVEKMFLPTQEGVELAWGSAENPLLVGILDVVGLDGVFGMDMLSNTVWESDQSGTMVVGLPNFQQLHFDFTNWNASGSGTMWLDLSPEFDVVVPEPAPWQMLLTASAMLFGLVWRRRQRGVA